MWKLEPPVDDSPHESLSADLADKAYVVNGPYPFPVIELFNYIEIWLAMYDHAKVSYNNRAYELKSKERRSFGNVETPVEENEQPLQENIDPQKRELEFVRNCLLAELNSFFPP